MALLAVSIPAYAQSDDELRHEMQLIVSRAYSECAAYYGTVVSNPDESNGLAIEDARDMHDEATVRAVAHAADVEGKSKARHIVDADSAEAKTELANLAEQDPEAFRDSMADYRKSCRMAVNDPPKFVDKTLLGQQPRRAYLQLPKGLTAEMILKNGKPTSGIKDIATCSKPANAHTFTLDDMLVESGMVCAKHQGGECESERLWMSYRQYIEEQYPDRTLAGYSEKLSITFKDGKSQRVRTLVACLELPRLRT